MKRVIPGLLTLALMGVVAWAGLRRPAVPRESLGNVEAAIAPAEARVHALLESAREGDVAAYLAAFDGPIRQRFERAIEERGREAFAADLRRAARSRKSRAVFAAELDSEGAASVAVETVYPDRIERQTFRLEQRPGGWLVTDVNTVRGREPAARFGSAAGFYEPEGVPVQPLGAAAAPEVP
jgi:hypothetical protein